LQALRQQETSEFVPIGSNTRTVGEDTCPPALQLSRTPTADAKGKRALHATARHKAPCYAHRAL